MTTTTTNGVMSELPISAKNIREIIHKQKADWIAARTRLLIAMDVHMTIARELGVDKAPTIKDLESQLSECVVALRVLDAKLTELPDALA